MTATRKATENFDHQIGDRLVQVRTLVPMKCEPGDDPYPVGTLCEVNVAATLDLPGRLTPMGTGDTMTFWHREVENA